LQQVVLDRSPATRNGHAPKRGGTMIYTRMGVVFHASSWSDSTYGITADGVWSTGPTHMEVFLPWTSVDSIRMT
jgi:hypothetical protein